MKHSLEINKFKQCKEKIQIIGNVFNDIKSKPFKIIGVYNYNYNYNTYLN